MESSETWPIRVSMKKYRELLVAKAKYAEKHGRAVTMSDLIEVKKV